MNSEPGVQWAAVEDDVRDVLAQPLQKLIAGDQALLVPEARRWAIPTAGRTALTEWGLPPLKLFTLRPQSEELPTLSPNLADAPERCLARDGQLLFNLGFWGSHSDSSVVGITPDDGRVLYLLPAPITVEDLPEVIRPHHPGMHKPAVSFLSPSVDQFVETAWRWHGALRILRRAEKLAPADWDEASSVEHYDRLYACVEAVVVAARSLNPATRAEDPESLWMELIGANSV